MQGTHGCLLLAGVKICAIEQQFARLLVCVSTFHVKDWCRRWRLQLLDCFHACKFTELISAAFWISCVEALRVGFGCFMAIMCGKNQINRTPGFLCDACACLLFRGK